MALLGDVKDESSATSATSTRQSAVPTRRHRRVAMGDTCQEPIDVT